MSEIRTDAEAVIAVAQEAAQPTIVDNPDRPHVFVDGGGVARLLDLDKYRLFPTRKTGVYYPATVASLIEYVKRYEDAETPGASIWVHPTSGAVVAVIDDDNPLGEPGFREHRAILQQQPTPEWTYWLERDGRWQGQVDFAEQIEGGLMDIIDPEAADLLELAQHFHAAKNATFRSSKRLANGETQFVYEEELAAKAGSSGQLEIPKSITLLLAPWIGEEPVELVGRFQYRLSGSTLTLRYVLERPHLVLRAAIDGMAERIGSVFANVYLGSPPTEA